MATANTRSLSRAMLTPSVAVLFIWMAVPLALTLWYSFQNYNLLNPLNSGFAGWSNYYYFLTDPSFFQAFGNTLILTLSVLAITVVGGILLGLLLDQPIFGQGIVRILVISPFFVMPTVAALVWKNMMLDPNYGIFAWIATTLRLQSRSVAAELSAVLDHHHRVVGVAALRHADPADRAAVAGRGAEGSGRHGRRPRAQPLLLHRAAAPGARHHRGDPDRDDLPARRSSPRSSSPPAAVPATLRPTSPISSTTRRCSTTTSAAPRPAAWWRSSSPTSSPSSWSASSARTSTPEGERTNGPRRHAAKTMDVHDHHLDRGAADLLPDPVDDPHLVQDRGRRDPLSAGVPSAALDAGELRRGPVALGLFQALLQFGGDRRRLDPAGADHRGAGRVVDGVLADQAHQGHPDVDALDQDDAGGRRAGADLPDLQEPRPARHASAG